MPAHSNEFPWPSYYGHFDYFESKMNQHKKVLNIESEDNGVYALNTVYAKKLRVFICECYSFGYAEYLETNNKAIAPDVIIINSMWCSYTNDAKRLARSEKKGLFVISELMGALNRSNYWAYLTKEQYKYFKENGWLK